MQSAWFTVIHKLIPTSERLAALKLTTTDGANARDPSPYKTD